AVAPAGGLRKPAERDCRHRAVHRTVPLQGDQSPAGTEPHKTAREARTNTTTADRRGVDLFPFPRTPALGTRRDGAVPVLENLLGIGRRRTRIRGCRPAYH